MGSGSTRRRRCSASAPAPCAAGSAGSATRSPRRTPGNHRLYELDEVEALREALRETHNISSAVEVARRRGRGPASPARLVAAFDRFDEAGADRELEESLAVRSVERTVSELLLPALELAARRAQRRRRARVRVPLGDRLAARRPPPRRRRDPRRGRPAARLGLARSASRRCTPRRSSCSCAAPGLRVLLLSAGLAEGRFRSALRALDPRAVVICGSEARLDVLGDPLRALRNGDGAVEPARLPRRPPGRRPRRRPLARRRAGRGDRRPAGQALASAAGARTRPDSRENPRLRGRLGSGPVRCKFCPSSGKLRSVATGFATRNLRICLHIAPIGLSRALRSGYQPLRR